MVKFIKKSFLKFLITNLLLSVIVSPLLFNITALADVNITSPSAILMEASTGSVIYANNEDERRSPASITKIMTLLLIFDSLSEGKINLTDDVITSKYASSMGGSQVFLAEGETQTVETLIKCIVVASGNDACVAMAEYIAGTEEEFVERMNSKASNLCMCDTNFIDCCGLTDSDEHYTTAKDVAIMSRELIIKHPEIFDYTGIWMEDIIHNTKNGESTFTLSSTNKLLKQYQWTTGLKTGSTSKAKYCLSATARKDGMDLIAVVLGAPDNKSRFQDARNLLSYGYNTCELYVDDSSTDEIVLPVKRGVEKDVNVKVGEVFRYLDTEGLLSAGVTKTMNIPEYVVAPTKKGDVIGEIIYYINQVEIGRSKIIFDEDIDKADFLYVYKELLKKLLLSA